MEFDAVLFKTLNLTLWYHTPEGVIPLQNITGLVSLFGIYVKKHLVFQHTQPLPLNAYNFIFH